MTRAASLFTLFLLLAALPAADDIDQLKVGVQPDGRIVVPTNQILKPAGMQVAFPGRPVDLAFAEGGRLLVVKNMRDLTFIDPVTTKVKQTLTLPKQKSRNDKISFGVIGLLVDGERVYVTDAQENLRVAERQADGSYKWG